MEILLKSRDLSRGLGSRPSVLIALLIMLLNAKEYDVDDVLVEVGQWGRYQQRIFIYFNIQHVLSGLVAISIIFIGVEPSWKCGVGRDSPQSRSLLDNEKCVMYEKQYCVVEVDQPYSSIVAEVKIQYVRS